MVDLHHFFKDARDICRANVMHSCSQQRKNTINLLSLITLLMSRGFRKLALYCLRAKMIVINNHAKVIDIEKMQCGSVPKLWF